ncbi:ShlB/FhaC/HecB family hemolysin secretion/activation protein [Enterobacteriaceae bacterium H4N4]|uniref:ShlB/FhaC/HecB family hemolysin secretion/activation protein n=1 Tax=Silvania confinis TaxID=2926470 RepID=A0A9J6QIE5_9ENTR|nr:ShlB/FhaC/HecB family hemolysin secretion/activation protein [Silvania confinis]MCU6669134.1 ShlB/FhaC/HecB family hemolysin secretion/activation protein [Silvania confinis]
MDIRSLLCVTTVFLIISFKATAEVKLGRLITEQKNNDSTSFHESKVEKKDVYSKAKDTSVTDNEFPQETPCYLIDELVIENDFLNNRGIRNIQHQVAGRCLGVKGLEKTAVLLQDYLIKSGYVTTRVDTPSQDLLSKKLILNVIPGRISNIIITDNNINKSLLPFGKGDILNIRDIEQGLENIQRTPGVDVKIKILPGDRNGTSVVEINPQRFKNWNLRTSYNNFGDESTGRQLVGAVGYLYNFARISDLFYLAGTSSQTGGYKNLSTHYSFPVGYSEFSIFYSNSKSTQGIDIGKYNFDYVGKTEYLSLKGYRMLRRDANSKLSAFAEIIRRKYNYSLGGEELVLQKRDMGNLRLGLNYKQNFTGSTLDSSISWQRFMTGLGGTKTPDMNTGAVSSRSQIVNLNVNYVNYVNWLTSLPVQAYYDMNLGVQYSPDKLTLQDKFSIANRWSVRGFENSGGIDGDNGFYVQNTLNIITGYRNSIAYVGTDYGQIVGDVSAQDVDGKKVMGGVIGVKGAVKALEYDLSLTSPFLYPDKMDVDKYIINFNIGYQL